MLPDSQNTGTSYTDPGAKELRHGVARVSVFQAVTFSLALPALAYTPLHDSCAGHTLATCLILLFYCVSNEAVVKYRLGSSITKV